MVSHDDKDCEIWLASKGTLSLDKQGYGGRKNYTSIPGFGNVFDNEASKEREVDADLPTPKASTTFSVGANFPTQAITVRNSNMETATSKEKIPQYPSAINPTAGRGILFSPE